MRKETSMARVDVDDLKNLDSINKLAEIFSHRLNYEYVDIPISTRFWKGRVVESIVNNDIKLLAKHRDFHIIYCRLNKLLLGQERPIISQLLKEHPYLLVIFSDSGLNEWHFVNIKYDDEVKNRRLFRRIVIGPDERLHTAAQRINMLEVFDEVLSSLELQIRHDKAFDIEEVTKEFYERYTEIFHILDEDIAEENPREDTYKEAQIILDRLIFLYFIQKKGWLNNNKRYLYENFLKFWKKDPKGNGFYSDFLVKLFQALSSQGDLYKDSLGNIPFLNGGLFEVDPFHSKLPFRLVIRNDTFKQIFDDLLEHFNFTVREDTPLDIEVAIDPEMLGKIFENLVLRLEKGEDLRKKTGSYYTPRVIVHFMCRQALKEYLTSEWLMYFTPKAVEPGRLPLKSTSQRKFSDIMIEKQEEEHRKKIEFLYTLNPADQLLEEEVNQLYAQITINDARALRELINKVYILDPAVGSGAFLVGMLHEMISILKLLDAREFGQKYIQKPNYDYELKRQLIETSLYGVDNQDQAVRICELRLWLSLIVDYERQKNEDIPPLPNLSYKIRCGDSLIEKLFGHNVQLDQLVRTDKGRQLIDGIREAKEAYFLEPNIREKNRVELSTLAKQCELMELLIKEKQKSLTGPQLSFLEETAKEKKEREEFEETKKEYERLLLLATNTRKKVEAMLKGKISIPAEDIPNLKEKLGISFIWKLDFAEVFKEKSGFDIVIANPPYISFGLRNVGKARAEWADYMRKNYPNSAEYKLSIYAIFMDKGLQLLKDKGTLSYITPDSFLLGRYFSKLRSSILRSCKIKEIVMFKKDFWQAGVVGRPVISNIQRDSDTNAKLSHRLIATLCTTLEKLSRDTLHSYSYEQRYFECIKYNRFRLFFSERAMSYVKTIEERSVPLGKIAKITTGVRSKIGQDKIIAESPKNKHWKKGIISGSQVEPFKVKWGGHYLNINKDILWAGGWDAKIVENPKLMIRQTGDSLVVGIDYDGLYHLNNVHSLSLKNAGVDISLECLCAILNSKLINRYYHLISLEKSRTMAQTDIETLETLPIKIPGKDIQNKIGQLIHKNSNSDTVNKTIEDYINDIYGLSEELRDYLQKDSLY